MGTLRKKRIRLDEIWKPVIGYEGWYEISNLGSIRNHRLHILKPRLKKNYVQVVLQKHGVVKHRLVHVLICEAFHGPKPTPFHEVNHKNGHKYENWDENLEWITHSQNVKHAIKNRLKVYRKGKHSKLAKHYTVITPNGKRIKIKGITNFCKRHGLYEGAMLSVARGKYSQHHGWGCEIGHL